MTLQKLVNRLNDLERRLAELESRESAPAYSNLQRDGKIGMAGDQLTPASSARINYNALYGISITEDFASATLSGWAWAGSPFVTPAIVQSRYSTWLHLSGMSGGERSFLYRTNFSYQLRYAMIPVLNTSYNGMYVGIRLDDGTDNNYVEITVRYSNTGSPFRIYYVSRINGGTVTETEATNLATPLLDHWLLGEILGTLWSSWYINSLLCSRNGASARPNVTGPTMTFTPARVGIVVKFGGSTWQSAAVDAVNF